MLYVLTQKRQKQAIYWNIKICTATALKLLNVVLLCILGCVKKAIKECLIAVNFANLRCQVAEIVNIGPILHDSVLKYGFCKKILLYE